LFLGIAMPFLLVEQLIITRAPSGTQAVAWEIFLCLWACAHVILTACVCFLPNAFGQFWLYIRGRQGLSTRGALTLAMAIVMAAVYVIGLAGVILLY